MCHVYYTANVARDTTNVLLHGPLLALTVMGESTLASKMYWAWFHLPSHPDVGQLAPSWLEISTWFYYNHPNACSP